MTHRSGDLSNRSDAPRPKLFLRLYVAGHAPNSMAALANLRALLPSGESADSPVELQVIDILREPARAMADGVWVSPTLLRLLPLPVVRIVGRLGDRQNVRLALGLRA